MSFQERLVSFHVMNSQLLATLSQTDHAKAALPQTTAHIADLEHDVGALEKELVRLRANVGKEQKEHVRYQNSTVKRLTYKLGCKSDVFNEKASREEREYFEAIQAVGQAEKQLSLLRATLQQEQAARAELAAAEGARAPAQEALDALYGSLFAGPTPGFPAEDAAEADVAAAARAHDAAGGEARAELQALRLLEHALALMAAAARDMAQAHSASSADAWGFGGGYRDLSERSALARAAAGVRQAQLLVGQARRLRPDGVRALPPTRVAQGNFMSDVIFDNIFSDRAFHDEIKESERQVVAALGHCRAQGAQAKARLQAAEAARVAAAEDLEAARRRLQEQRVRAFERVMEEQGPPPPEYTP